MRTQPEARHSEAYQHSTPYPVFNPHLSRDLLAEHFNLYPADFKLLKRIRQDSSRLGCAVLLKTLTYLGFPEDFMFELTKEEFDNLRSQIATSKRGGTRYVPMVFTEQGVAMLSSVLRSKRAIHANLLIMRAFVKLRRFVLDNETLKHDMKELNRELKELRKQTEGRFQIVFETIDRLLAIEEKPKRKIGF